jgi:hypothetical protein
MLTLAGISNDIEMLSIQGVLSFVQLPDESTLEIVLVSPISLGVSPGCSVLSSLSGTI